MTEAVIHLAECHDGSYSRVIPEASRAFVFMVYVDVSRIVELCVETRRLLHLATKKLVLATRARDRAKKRHCKAAEASRSINVE